MVPFALIVIYLCLHFKWIIKIIQFACSSQHTYDQLTWKYSMQLLNVYAPRFETGGKFWPIVHNATIFSLILMQAIALGIFGLKKLPLASSLIVPLPILTLLFNYYCRKRFLPIFKSYSAEVLILSIHHWIYLSLLFFFSLLISVLSHKICTLIIWTL